MPNPLIFAAALTTASLSPFAKDALAPAPTTDPTFPYALHLPTDGDQYFTLELKPGDDAPFQINPDEFLKHNTIRATGVTLTDSTDATIIGGPLNDRTLAYQSGASVIYGPYNEYSLAYTPPTQSRYEISSPLPRIELQSLDRSRLPLITTRDGITAYSSETSQLDTDAMLRILRDRIDPLPANNSPAQDHGPTLAPDDDPSDDN